MNRIETFFSAGKFFNEKTLLISFIWVIFISSLPAFSWVITGKDYIEYLVIPNIALCLFILTWFPVNWYLNRKLASIRESYKKITASIRENSSKLYENYSSLCEIEDILEYSNNLYSYLESIKDYRKMSEKALSPLAQRYLKEYIVESIKFALVVLRDIYDDMKIGLKKKRYLLLGAKSSLSSVSWTPELTQVSEIQRTRLDRQIEQFEALQRILTKI